MSLILARRFSRYRTPLTCKIVSRWSSSSSVTPRTIQKLLELKLDDGALPVEVNGWVRSVRAQKRFYFVSLGDGSSLNPLQAVVPAEKAEGIAIGAAVRLAGSWIKSPGAGQSHELQVEQAEVLGSSDAKTFPLQKKYQTPEYLRTLPHLRPRIPFNSAVLRFRSQLISSLTRFFEANDYTQIHTPVLTSSDCEGAGEVFDVSAGAQKTAASLEDPARQFFRRPTYLTVSGQLHLEALAQALGNVWTLSPTFRAEQSDTPRHLSEFYMLEAEMSFTDRMDEVMNLVESMLRGAGNDLSQSRVVHDLRTRIGDRSDDLASTETVEQRWRGLEQKRWPRITYTEAIGLLKSADQSFEHTPVWGSDLQTEHEKYLAKLIGNSTTPVFVTHYPRDIKAFYMRATPENEDDTRSDGATVECFDLLVPDFCEIVGGSMREHRLESLLKSMQRHGLKGPSTGDTTHSSDAGAKSNNLDWYLDLRRWGCPPHGGFGLGFDRLICYLSGVQTIRDTAAFPRWFGRCDC